MWQQSKHLFHDKLQGGNVTKSYYHKGKFSKVTLKRGLSADKMALRRCGWSRDLTERPPECCQWGGGISGLLCKRLGTAQGAPRLRSRSEQTSLALPPPLLLRAQLRLISSRRSIHTGCRNGAQHRWTGGGTATWLTALYTPPFSPLKNAGGGGGGGGVGPPPRDDAAYTF